MRFSKQLTSALAVLSGVAAQRPANMSICDYYTTALLKNNTAANQYTLLTLVVNTAVIGNYTQPNVGISVAGILAPGMVNGTQVNLLPYFNGQLASTNQGGSAGVSMNFLDGGGAAPLKMNKPANDNTSNQYGLMTHLYQLFGALLQCSEYGMGAFPAYMGQASLYEVHKFMALDNAQVTYFIEQVGMAAASFGVTKSDVEAVGTALETLFGMRCAAPVTVIPAQGPQLQAICIDADCPLAPNATCSSYQPVVQPMTANMTSTSSMSSGMPMTMTMTTTGASGSVMTMTTTGMATGTGSAPTSKVTTAGAATQGLSMMAVACGLAALLL